MKYYSHLLFLSAITIAFAACGGDAPDPPQPEPPEVIPALSFSMSRSPMEFRAGDAVGVYVAYDKIFPKGNYLDNLRLTLGSNGIWSQSSAVLWKNGKDRASFYAYSPYRESVENAQNVMLSVNTDQSAESNLDASQFYWASLLSKTPTESAIAMKLSPRMSTLCVQIVPGDGFSAEDIVAQLTSIHIKGFQCNAVADLTTGKVKANGSVCDITPYHRGTLTFEAIVPPQNVSGKEMVEVFLNDDKYTLKSSLNAESGRSYDLTIQISRTQNGINVGIAGWEDAGEDYGGTVN